MSKLQERAIVNRWSSMSGKKPPSVGSIVRTTFLLVMTFVILAPVLWFILSSFKDPTDLSARPPKIFPTTWAFSNYTEAFQMYNYMRYFMNSVIVTSVATILTLLINSMAAYAFAKYNFRGRDGLFCYDPSHDHDSFAGNLDSYLPRCFILGIS